MNKYVLMSISLLIFIIGVGCAAAADVNINGTDSAAVADGSSAIDDAHVANDLDAVAVLSEDLSSHVDPQYLSTDLGGRRGPRGVEASVERPTAQEASLVERRGTRGADIEQLTVVESALNSALGGGGGNSFYCSASEGRDLFATPSIIQSTELLGGSMGGGEYTPYY